MKFAIQTIEKLDIPQQEKDNIFYGEGSWFDLYENSWLQNISDNTKARNELTRIKNVEIGLQQNLMGSKRP